MSPVSHTQREGENSPFVFRFKSTLGDGICIRSISEVLPFAFLDSQIEREDYGEDKRRRYHRKKY